MDFQKTEIKGLFLIKPFVHEDGRGTFVKTFHEEVFKKQGLEAGFKESFYSESVKGVIRGMHFQLPPYDHAKLVFSTSGEVLDVIVDLRKDSETFGKFQSFELSSENKNMLYIPRGLAHGFCAISDIATLFYFTTSVHNKDHDAGIRFDSFGFDWPVTQPVLSPRDLNFPEFKDFASPF